MLRQHPFQWLPTLGRFGDLLFQGQTPFETGNNCPKPTLSNHGWRVHIENSCGAAKGHNEDSRLDLEYSHLSWDTDTLARRWFTWIDNFDYIQFKQYKKQVFSSKVEVSSKEESGIAVPFSPLPCLSLLCSSFPSSCHCCSPPPPPDPPQGPPSCPPSPPLCLLPPLLSSQHPWSCSSPQQHHDTSLFSLLLGWIQCFLWKRGHFQTNFKWWSAI